MYIHIYGMRRLCSNFLMYVYALKQTFQVVGATHKSNVFTRATIMTMSLSNSIRAPHFLWSIRTRSCEKRCKSKRSGDQCDKYEREREEEQMK